MRHHLPHEGELACPRGRLLLFSLGSFLQLIVRRLAEERSVYFLQFVVVVAERGEEDIVQVAPLDQAIHHEHTVLSHHIHREGDGGGGVLLRDAEVAEVGSGGG